MMYNTILQSWEWKDAIQKNIDCKDHPLASLLDTNKFEECRIQPAGRVGHTLIKDGFLKVAKGLQLHDVLDN